MKKLILFLLLLQVLPAFSQADLGSYESSYRDYFAQYINAIETEYGILSESSLYRKYADIITDEYIIECEKSDNWVEAVGQVLYYKMMTDLKPVILFIHETNYMDEIDEKSLDNLAELLRLAEEYQITVWSIGRSGDVVELLRY